MITRIGIIAGEILEALDQSNGVLVFGEIHSILKQNRELVLMSLGWLLREGYICIIEDPTRSIYRNNDIEKAYSSEAFMFDLVVKNNVVRPSSLRIKDMPGHISIVADKILLLMEGCGGYLNSQTFEWTLNEHKDIVLMSLGWLIRQGYVRGLADGKGIRLFQLPKENEISKIELFSHV